MLILSRSKGEAIRIGSEVRIVVLHVGGGRVRLGIEGPRELCILREELYTEVVDLNRAASLAPQSSGALDAFLKTQGCPAADATDVPQEGPHA